MKWTGVPWRSFPFFFLNLPFVGELQLGADKSIRGNSTVRHGQGFQDCAVDDVHDRDRTGHITSNPQTNPDSQTVVQASVSVFQSGTGAYSWRAALLSLPCMVVREHDRICPQHLI